MVAVVLCTAIIGVAIIVEPHYQRERRRAEWQAWEGRCEQERAQRVALEQEYTRGFRQGVSAGSQAIIRENGLVNPKIVRVSQPSH
jgi:hypothetical protein